MGSLGRQLRKHIELPDEQRRLQFGDPVIGAEHALLVLIRRACPPAVYLRLQVFEILKVGCDYDSALAGGHELAFLKAETTEVAHGARSLAAVLPAVCVSAILDHIEPMFAGEG